ncbi:GAF domain-containing sensor histidine kinase [Penaeicola halotolerans]|uniref:GAF domain-containing sensor histidine kinase n=1 Tax=Penaeicola halotolerans TaxID=2793196 RepID=UPI001CF8F088|nr:GAF domain-containing sensor histidine kinase [Penaeicola halotolerans]
MAHQAPIPSNEFDRIIKLSEFDLDYTNIESNFKDLNRLAAKVAGVEVSLVNLIDAFTQWSVSGVGELVGQLPREESVCQYTITESEKFEVRNLAQDIRFKDKSYVTEENGYRYYFGVPLKVGNLQIGALCVLDRQEREELSPEKVEMLKIIADEVVNRIKVIHAMQELRNKVNQANLTQKKVAHDIRGPLGGIVGLAEMISEQGNENKMEEVLQFISLIQKSGRSILELANEILSSDKPKVDSGEPKSDQFNLATLQEKLLQLFVPQAKTKQIDFQVAISTPEEHTPFSKNKLLQIIGNLISNAIKFTESKGKVLVDLSFRLNVLVIKVTDTGVGLSKDKIEEILAGQGKSTAGTSGESGYGFGLTLVKHLVEDIGGNMSIDSTEGEGATFIIKLPIKP